MGLGCAEMSLGLAVVWSVYGWKANLTISMIKLPGVNLDNF